MTSPAVSHAEPIDLPVHLTRFVGRDCELDDLARLLADVRLLTLTGAGGSGKTRLAHETATRAAHAFARTVWVDLSLIADSELLAHQVTAALHVFERPGESPIALLTAAVGAERLLLVLDNCEHLVDACATFAEAMLRACPRATLLATSREALGIGSETAWLVPPLATVEAVQLFTERAQAALPSFTTTDANAVAVGEICRRLDGIPLAIELAAARVRVLPVEQIASRLDDAFRLLTVGSRTALPRHRTLRATMEWSFSLLTTREQLLLGRLSVFAGSFTLEAAESVCAGGPLCADDILDGVSALVDKSLAVMEAGDGIARYHLLETVRQYAQERRAETGEADELQARHAHFFLACIEAAAPQLFGGETEHGLIARLAADNENLRAAAAWSVRDDGRADLALRFAGSFFWYWYGSTMGFGAGQFREGRRFVSEALARGSTADPVLRGRAYAARALIGLAQGDNLDASADFAEALHLLRMHGDATTVGWVLAKYGACRLMLGDLETAVRYVDESFAIAERLPDEGMLNSFAASWRGLVAVAHGDFVTARAMYRHNLAVGRAMQHRTILGHGHAFTGGLELAEGRRADEAFTQFIDALNYHLELGDGWGLALDIEGLAAVAALRGRHADSVRLLGAVDALRERSAVSLPACDAADRARRVASARTRLGDAMFDRYHAEGRSLAMDEVTRLATNDAVMQTAEHRVPPVLVSGPDRATTVTRASLRVQALGPLQVFVNGDAIASSSWGSARPRELLVYLLMHPDGRTKEQAGLAFWPDASAAQLRNSFHVTLHRLRKALGRAEWVTLTNDRYRIDPAVIEEFDVAAFERELTAARRAITRQDADATDLLERALARFRGDFLDGEPVGDWHLEHRDRLQRLYIEALLELGARLTAEERQDSAAEVYRRILARDELHEEACLALMRCHASVGERSQALRVYRRFADRMRAELHAEPDRGMTRFSERLQQSAAV